MDSPSRDYKDSKESKDIDIPPSPGSKKVIAFSESKDTSEKVQSNDDIQQSNSQSGKQRRKRIDELKEDTTEKVYEETKNRRKRGDGWMSVTDEVEETVVK